ncbi:calcineurin-binding protein 1 [Citrus sinensis]|uniref:Calcineurin-binding protein 1 n=1 Tax=Citrus sinensis TaxID=2711 RepID=A0ACB8NPV5_CITSI|nr:calcineurin-binding protein 1 [Citrus sinensis]
MEVYLPQLTPLPPADKSEGIKSVELLALDILIKACEKIEPMNSEMCLSCHRRKLQILMAVSGMDASLASCKTFFQNSGLKTHSASDMVSTENSSKQWYHLVADEIKAILQCISQVKNFIDQSRDYVTLIAAIHDLLSEYGLCRAGEGDGGGEGTFLKFAIKHLLALNVKLKPNFSSSNKENSQYDKQLSHHDHFKISEDEIGSDAMDLEMVGAETCETVAGKKDDSDGTTSNGMPSHLDLEKENSRVGSDSSYEDDLVTHRNTSRGDYKTKERSADVFQCVLPYAKASSKTGLVKLRRVLRAIHKHFPQPPEDDLAGNAIDKFLDDLDLCEDILSEESGSDGYLGNIMKIIFRDIVWVKQFKAPSSGSSEPYLEVYRNLYYYLAQAEEMSTTDKWPGFELTKEGEGFVQKNANLFKFDLLYNPLRFESWQRLANIYDEARFFFSVVSNMIVAQIITYLIIVRRLLETSYLHEHIVSLETKGKLETLEAINEKIRKRFKNPKLSNSNCAKVCRHASVAWCRSLIISLASITPLRSLPLSGIQAPNSMDGGLENSQLLCVYLQINEIWNSSFEEKIHLKTLEITWNPILSKLKNIIMKKAADENVESAYAMLRISYNFYRESSCVTLPSGVNLYLVPSRLASEAQFQPGIDGVETVCLSIPRKLLLWSYTLLQGRCASISAVVKHCEENVKIRKLDFHDVKFHNCGPSDPVLSSCHAIQEICSHYPSPELSFSSIRDSSCNRSGTCFTVTIICRDNSGYHSAYFSDSCSVSPRENTEYVLALPSSAESQKTLITAPPLQLCRDAAAERSPQAQEGDNQDRV